MERDKSLEMRGKSLDMAISQIEKQFGKGSIMKMDDAAIKDIDVVSTGSLGLDVALGLGHHVHGHGGLARGLGTVDLDHPAPGQAADAEGEIEGQGPRGDGLDVHRRLVAHLHDRTLAVGLLDLADGHLE